MSPSTPLSFAMRASSGFITPFTTRRPCQRLRINARCCQFKWSFLVKSRSTSRARIGAPRVASEFSKCGMPWRTSVRSAVPKSQRGCVMPSQASRGLGLSGVENPARTLFSRLESTATSTVTTSVPKPAAAARSMMPRILSISPGRYAWNHVSGHALHTSSRRMSDEPLMIMGMFEAFAPRACTRSPRYADSALMPMGATPKGAEYSRPKSVDAVERFETSISTRGMKPSSSKAARLSRTDASVSTPPETYANTGRGRWRRAACSKSSSDRMVRRCRDKAVGFFRRRERELCHMNPIRPVAASQLESSGASP